MGERRIIRQIRLRQIVNIINHSFSIPIQISYFIIRTRILIYLFPTLPHSSADDTHLQGIGVRLKSVPILDRRQGLKHDDVFPQYYGLISTNQAYARNDLHVSI